MLTMKMWPLLQKPQRSIYKQFFLDSRKKRHPKRKVYLTTIITSAMIFAACMVPTLFFFICSSPLLFLLAGTLCGAYTAMRISSSIAQEYERTRYELIAMTPLGKSGTNWLICRDVYQGINTVKDISKGVIWLLALFGALSMMWLVIALATATEIYGVLLLLAGITIVYADLVQSIVMGCIIGMTIPTYSEEQLSARAVGLGGFLLIQFLFYAIALVIISALSFILTDFHIPGSLVLIIGFGMLALLREGLIIALWYWLAHRLETDVTDLNEALA